MSISFTEPQMAYLTEEAGKLGISIVNLLDRIVDQYRNTRSAAEFASESKVRFAHERSLKRREAIAYIRQHMEEDGRYVPPYESERRQRDLDIYRRVIGGETKASVGRSVGLSKWSVWVRYKGISREIERKKLYQEHPEMIEHSPLPVRLVNILLNNGISQFHELNGRSRSQLAKSPNCGKESMNTIEAYLELKFPQYVLDD